MNRVACVWLASLASAALLSCSGAGAGAGAAPPPPPRQGLPVAPGSAPPAAAEKKPCGCSLKLAPAPSSAPEAPPPPISGELPQGPFDLERRSACTAPVCRLDGFVPDQGFLHTTRDGLPSTTAVWLETIAQDSTLSVPHTSHIHVLALVLEGTVAAAEGEPKAASKPSSLNAWSALTAPEAGFYLQARGGRASVLLVAAAKSGTLADAVSLAQKSKPPASRSQHLQTSDLRAVQKLSWAGGAYHARIAFPSAAPGAGASLTLLQASGSGAIAEHTHSAEWEHTSILRGGGQMLLGNAKYPIQPGAVFHTPKGTVHGWQGAGDELAAVVVYSPAGPEQRFLSLAAAAK